MSRAALGRPLISKTHFASVIVIAIAMQQTLERENRAESLLSIATTIVALTALDNEMSVHIFTAEHQKK